MNSMHLHLRRGRPKFSTNCLSKACSVVANGQVSEREILVSQETQHISRLPASSRLVMHTACFNPADEPIWEKAGSSIPVLAVLDPLSCINREYDLHTSGYESLLLKESPLQLVPLALISTYPVLPRKIAEMKTCGMLTKWSCRASWGITQTNAS